MKELIQLIEDKKGENITTINVADVFPFADTFIIATASNERLLKAIADYIKDESPMYKKTEGDEKSGWLIVDCTDVIVHLFLPQIREYYALDKLWQKNN